MNYEKLNKSFKWGMVGLMIVSVIILVAGFIIGWEANGASMAEVLLDWAYIMVLLAIVAVIGVGLAIGIKDNPKGLVKLGAGIGILVVLALVAFIFASGADAIGLTTEMPSKGTLKLTDTILNLAYISGAAAVVAIIVGEIRIAKTDRKK